MYCTLISRLFASKEVHTACLNTVGRDLGRTFLENQSNGDASGKSIAVNATSIFLGILSCL